MPKDLGPLQHIPVSNSAGTGGVGRGAATAHYFQSLRGFPSLVAETMTTHPVIQWIAQAIIVFKPYLFLLYLLTDRHKSWDINQWLLFFNLT